MMAFLKVCENGKLKVRYRKYSEYCWLISDDRNLAFNTVIAITIHYSNDAVEVFRCRWDAGKINLLGDPIVHHLHFRFFPK
jgi:hypothetical protein